MFVGCSFSSITWIFWEMGFDFFSLWIIFFTEVTMLNSKLMANKEPLRAIIKYVQTLLYVSRLGNRNSESRENTIKVTISCEIITRFI